MRIRIWGATCVLAALAGCASVGDRVPVRGDTLTGRLAVRVAAHESTPAQAVSATFELAGTPDQGRLNLSSPFGTVLAQARWAQQQAWLVTPEGERGYATLDELTREILGEQLPVAALFDWLRGRPWAGAPSTPSVNPVGFQQLGWSVDLTRFPEGWVTADRPLAPAVQVRARVDTP